ncbi:Gfo/Idh/MocA family protein [Planctomicrobium sp. SH661]|uniref:Gfo/Idh/MocA family protein n=1 Tax=Planctomicrobium sp. SH661 TaxID=3448124 RepID=UPI003F5C6DB4
MTIDLNFSTSSRREFLGTAIAGGALLLSSLGSRAYAGNGEPIKVALIGSGSRGAGAAAQALSTPFPVKLWAMADAFPDRLESSLKALKAGSAGAYNLDQGDGFDGAIDVPEERRFVGLDAYRKAIDSGVDVVIITGPPAFRPQHFEYAVNAGKHVFMEKPLATDAAGVRRILAAAQIAKQKNLKVGVGLQRHHESSYQEAIQRIHDGEIGRIVAIRAYWNGGLPAKKPFPRENLTELEYQVRNWYFFNWLSGDHNVEQHIHNLDVGNWIANAHPVSAEGIGGRQVRTGKEFGNIFDHHTVEYTYADGTKMYSQCRQIPGCQKRVAEFVEATEGQAELGGNRFALLRGEEKVWQPGRKDSGKKISPYQVEHNVLFEAIVQDKPHNEAENGAYSTLTAIMGRLATYSGQLIRWDEPPGGGAGADRSHSRETWDGNGSDFRPSVP